MKKKYYTALTLIILGGFLVLAAGNSAGYNSSETREIRILNSPQYNADAEKFVNAKPIELLSGSGFFKVMKEYWNAETIRVPLAKLPEDPPDLSELENISGDIRFMWFGHSTILLELEGKRILFDPVFSKYASPVWTPKRFQPPVYQVDEIKNIDFVVISHDHYDHLDHETIMKLSKRKELKFLVSLGVGEHLENWGIPSSRIIEMDWWESAEQNGIQFVSTPAQHFSGRGVLDRNKTLWSSWTLIGKKRRVFFSGDGGYSDHFKIIGDKYGPFDLTFMENGQYNVRWRDVHSLPHETVQAHIDLKGKAMVPIHWGMFELSLHDWFEPIVRAEYESKKRNVNLLTPMLGQLVSLNKHNQFLAWWKPYLPDGYLLAHDDGNKDTFNNNAN